MASSILVIEDDPSLMRSICRNLTARGHHTRGVMTVSEATTAIEQEIPSMVVADIDLPDGSGWEILRALRDSGHREVAAIVMSAIRPNPRLAKDLGVIGTLEKPFPIDSLLRMVASRAENPGPRPDGPTAEDWE